MKKLWNYSYRVNFLHNTSVGLSMDAVIVAVIVTITTATVATTTASATDAIRTMFFSVLSIRIGRMWSHGQTFLSDFYSCCCFFFASLLRFLTIIANTDANANADATVEQVVAVDAVVIVVMIIVRIIIIRSSTSIIIDGGGSVNDRVCCIRKADHGSYKGKDWYSNLRNGKEAPSEKRYDVKLSL